MRMHTPTDRFRAAHAPAAEWQQGIAHCLRQLALLPSGANLGFLYATDVLAPALPQILRQLKTETGIPHWVGTVGIGIMGNGDETMEQPAISVMVGRFAADSFRVFPSVRADVAELQAASGEWCRARGARFAVVHGDPRNARTPSLLADIATSLDGGYLVGGITSSRGPYLQIADDVTTGGISGVLFAGDVAVVTGLTQGCTPLEPVHEITRANDNLLIEIDGRPALDVLKEDIGEVLARDLSRAAGYIFAGLPIRGSDTGDYLVRNLLGVDLQQKVIAIGDHVHAGDAVMFCKRDVHTADADLQRLLADLKRRATTPPRGALYYSCLGRGPNMFGPTAAELQAIRRVFPELPVVGFYANGEISHNRLYGYTGVLTLFL